MALSLGTRDPAVARRIGWRVHAEIERMIDGALTPTAPACREFLSSFIARELRFSHDRFQADVFNAPPPGTTRDGHLFDRARQARIFAELNRVMHERGFDAAYDETLEQELAARKIDDFERIKVRQRIDHGILQRWAKPDNNGIDTPPPIFLKELVGLFEGTGSLDPIVDALRGIALIKARTESVMADLYVRAKQDPEGACKELMAHLAAHEETIEISAAPRSMDGCDDIALGRFEMHEADGGIHLTPRSLASRNSDPEAERGAEHPQCDDPGDPPASRQDDISHGRSVNGSCDEATPLACLADPVTDAIAARQPPTLSTVPIGRFASPRVAHATEEGDRTMFLLSLAPIAKEQVAPVSDPDRSITHLIRRYCHDERRDAKASRQFHALGFLITHVIGSDDVADCDQIQIAKTRAVLDFLPKNWGKSSRDRDTTLHEFERRGREMLRDSARRHLVGLGPGTINRILTQLKTIIGYGDGLGLTLGDANAISKLRPQDNRSADEKAVAFTEDDVSRLFAHPIFTESNLVSALCGVKGSWSALPCLYWLPLLGLYAFARLGELCYIRPQDIDINGKLILLRETPERSLKTVSSKRDVPIHDELVRLGFLDYVEHMQRLGSVLLFPELRRLAPAADLVGVFETRFNGLLDDVFGPQELPRKTFKSFRKSGNSWMTNKGVLDGVRKSIMGHSREADVNSKHYQDDFLILEAKFNAVNGIGNLTSNLQPLAFQP